MNRSTDLFFHLCCWVLFLIAAIGGMACAIVTQGCSRPLHAAPAPRRKAPAPAPRTVNAKSLADTHWKYLWGTSEWVLTFHKNGRFSDRSAAYGSSAWRGTWSYEDGTIVLTCDGASAGLHLHIVLDNNTWADTLPGTIYWAYNLNPFDHCDGTLKRVRVLPWEKSTK